MKRLLLAGLFGIFSLATVKAQDIETIRNQVLLRQFKAAKTAIDKAVTAEKLAKKPETWALKANIYSSLANDSANSREQAEALRAEAVTAFNKYKEIDPKFELMKDNNYTNGPINLYTASFKKGVEGFNSKNWQDAFANFVASVDYADFLIATKIITTKMDTTSILYAGASAQNLKTDAGDVGAFKYFTRLADAGVAGKDYEFLYQYLTNYYMNKKDDANFAKYIALGKQHYPDSKYFPAVEEDYANSKDVYYLNMREGEELFAKLYPKEDKDIPPGDLTPLEAKMVEAFTKAAEAKPEKAGLSYSNIGNHFINKGVAVNKNINVINDAIKQLNRAAKPDKNGKLPPPPKDSVAKRDVLYKEYDGYADQAIAAYEKAAESYAKKAGSLISIEKQAYKNSVSYLIDLYAEKKSATAKSKPADSAKFAAMEKKWSDIYSSIK
ncbi:MAG: hypothetical protein V4722_04085 [Bacteroidota bacterium]